MVVKTATGQSGDKRKSARFQKTKGKKWRNNTQKRDGQKRTEEEPPGKEENEGEGDESGDSVTVVGKETEERDKEEDLVRVTD